MGFWSASRSKRDSGLKKRRRFIALLRKYPGVVELYASSGRMGDAQKVFDEVPDRNVVVWNLMVRGFCDSEDVEKGLGLFQKMSERSVVSWNSMKSSLSKCGRDHEALELFCEMIDQGFDPDKATVVTVLPISASLGVLDTGKWIHATAESKGLVKDFITVGNALVDFYCKSGDSETATAIFRKMQRRNVVSWK